MTWRRVSERARGGAAPSGKFGAGFAVGMAVGGGAAVLRLTWSGLRAQRRLLDGDA